MLFRRRLLASLFTALAVTVGVVSPSAIAATPTPSKVSVTSTSRDAVAISWKAIANVPKYRVQYSTSPTMRNPSYLRFATPYAEITGLKAATTYYLKVRAITADGKNLSSYSAAVTARTTGATGYTLLSPTGLEALSTTTDSLSLSWNPRSSQARYRLSWSTSSSFSDPHYVRVADTSATLTGLTPGTRYYLKVRVIDADGVNLSRYSPPITVTTTAVPRPGGFDLPPPSGLAVSARARTAVAISWTAAKGAERYRVQYSTSSSMSSASYLRTSGTTAEIGGLTAGRAYYFRVRVITPDGVNLSSYSGAVSAKTPTSSEATYLAPTGLRLDPKSANKAAVSWTSRGSGLTYVVAYADNASFERSTAVLATTTSTSLTGLAATTEYWVKVRVVDSTAKHGALSAFSPAVSAQTTSSVPSTLRVASYNVKCANCYSAVANEGTWYQRRQAVVDTILGQKPDVIGIQEASQAWLKANDGVGSPISLSQFEDLANRLGAPYKLANSHRNNCERSTTPTKCVYKDQGASQGTKIIYNSAALSLVEQGSQRLAEVNPSDNDRYVAWAILEQKSSGKRFFFADTHLDHLDDVPGSTDYYNIRITQTRQIIALVASKAKDLPAYVVGDFNSNKWTSPSNGPYDVMRAAGFVDPLGNTYRSTTTTSGATVEARIRTNFASYNGYNRKAPSVSYVNASYIDYIWTSKNIEVPEWETVVNIDAAGNFIGTIPSDHNMIRATTTLP